MNKIHSFILILFSFLFLFLSQARAEEFSLKKIGTLNVNGKYYSHWWFSGTKPVFEGTGSRGANIDVTIDSNFKTVKASAADGSWTFTPETDLEKKDHTVTVASGSDKISFILTIGSDQVPADANSQGNLTELPQTGNLIPALLIITLSGVLIYYGLRGKLV